MDPVHDVTLSFADFQSGHRNEQLARALLGQQHHRLDPARHTSIEPDVKQRALKLPLVNTSVAALEDHIADLGNPDLRRDRAMLERATATVRDSLLEAAQAASEASHRARALAEMLDQSLAMLASAEGARSTRPAPARVKELLPAADLSEREREVLTHVAAGRSNKDIARVLYLSPNTVKTHVSSLLRKLNASSRAQLATFAVQQGLGA
jgi:DNA-binding CsgD family transcriptional regulator